MQEIQWLSSCEPKPMQRSETPNRPWQDLAADLTGPMPSGESLLVIVDYYSHYYEVEILPSTTASMIIAALTRNLTKIRITVLSQNRQRPAVCVKFTEFLRECGIEHRTLPLLWPQANWEVERQNRSILKALMVANAVGKKWTQELPKFLLAYRSTPTSQQELLSQYLEGTSEVNYQS